MRYINIFFKCFLSDYFFEIFVTNCYFWFIWVILYFLVLTEQHLSALIFFIFLFFLNSIFQSLLSHLIFTKEIIWCFLKSINDLRVFGKIEIKRFNWLNFQYFLWSWSRTWVAINFLSLFHIQGLLNDFSSISLLNSLNIGIVHRLNSVWLLNKSVYWDWMHHIFLID